MKTVIYPNVECYSTLINLFVYKEIIDDSLYEEYGLDEEYAKGLYQQSLTEVAIMLQYPTIVLQTPALQRATMDILKYYLEKVEDYAAEHGVENIAEQHEAMLDVKETMDFVETLKENIEIDESNEL